MTVRGQGTPSGALVGQVTTAAHHGHDTVHRYPTAPLLAGRAGGLPVAERVTGDALTVVSDWLT